MRCTVRASGFFGGKCTFARNACHVSTGERPVHGVGTTGNLPGVGCGEAPRNFVGDTACTRTELGAKGERQWTAEAKDPCQFCSTTFLPACVDKHAVKSATGMRHPLRHILMIPLVSLLDNEMQQTPGESLRGFSRMQPRGQRCAATIVLQGKHGASHKERAECRCGGFWSSMWK